MLSDPESEDEDSPDEDSALPVSVGTNPGTSGLNTGSRRPRGRPKRTEPPAPLSPNQQSEPSRVPVQVDILVHFFFSSV